MTLAVSRRYKNYRRWVLCFHLGWFRARCLLVVVKIWKCSLGHPESSAVCCSDPARCRFHPEFFSHFAQVLNDADGSAAEYKSDASPRWYLEDFWNNNSDDVGFERGEIYKSYWNRSVRAAYEWLWHWLPPLDCCFDCCNSRQRALHIFIRMHFMTREFFRSGSRRVMQRVTQFQS